MMAGRVAGEQRPQLSENTEAIPILLCLRSQLQRPNDGTLTLIFIHSRLLVNSM